MTETPSRREGEEPPWWEHLLDDTDPADYPTRDEPVDEFADLPEKYIPPEPPPLPILSPPTVLGGLAVVGGLVSLIWPDMLTGWLGVGETLALVLGLGLLLAGAITLLYRLRPGGEDDETPSPPDEGAIV